MTIQRQISCAAALIVSLSLLFAAPALASFGFQSFETSFVNHDGSPDVQAGSHPWEMTTSFNFHETTNANGELVPDGNVKDIQVELPAGLTGDPTSTPKCTSQQFHTPNPHIPFSGASCPESTQVGMAAITTLGASTPGFFLGVYNLVPTPGVPAEFGFNVVGVPVVLKPSVRTGGDYGLTVSSDNTNQGLNLFATTVTLWGVPADSSHDEFRGECLISYTGESGCSHQSEVTSKPFLTLPTSCSGSPLTTSVDADSWQEPGAENPDGSPDLSDPLWKTASSSFPALAGCERLDFSPKVSIRPDTSAASSPSGLSAEVQLPQIDNPAGLAEAELKKAVVTLPVGMSVNPSAADGRAACTPAQIEINSAQKPSCPDASKVGSVQIETPLLEAPLTGSVYLAQPDNNPFGSLLALYVVAEGVGVSIKLAGHVEANPLTGQLQTTFDNNPQQPFSNLQLTFFEGPRAALSTPAACGTYEAESSLTPWSTGLAVASESPFKFTSNCGGGFSPSFAAGTTNNQAGAFSPFSVTISRSDEDQTLGAVSVRTPPGLLGMLSKVSLCGEPQASLGTCSSASQIGHVTTAAGVGPDPVSLPQAGKPQDPVFLTGPYKGAPFGLSVVVPAEAGPFDLGTVVVRAAVSVDPHTAQITIASDPLPTFLQGIPLDIRTVNVTVDREGFIFNPTNCEPLTVTGALASTQGASAGVSSRFQAANCASLAFKPKLTASTRAHTSRLDGASLTVNVSMPSASPAGPTTGAAGMLVGGDEANIAKVELQLPKQLPSRLKTLQKACTAAQFESNPAGCPVASNIGYAKALTPVLSVPLTGPAYLVSHGGAAFPDVEFVLQGEGVTIDLDGKTQIKKGVTYSRFQTVPDAPVTSFEATLPQGEHAILGTDIPASARGSLCKQKLAIPTTITAQNGAVVKQSTKLAVTGCAKPKQVKHKHKVTRVARGAGG